ncbi:aminopeptidase P family protein [Candidatus Nomurabacteria bacterium]|nr:aminopeptidase P family protein [Candidatus Nomurabacteria bacterium]MCB9819586.1 aminopeptidase P family protein [Candidatus Nomurabacteria bacterium]
MNKPTSLRKKTPEQIRKIEGVQKATEAAMKSVIDYIQTASDPTAEEAHEIIDVVLAQHNCESPEGHIVAGGIKSFEPHERGSGLLEKGAPIVIDIFPRSKETGYYADMSRTVCIGEPEERLKNMYNAVLQAQELAISMIKPKVICADIQTAVENLFAELGYITSGKGKEFPFAEGFVHSVGHGVGINIHEAPTLSRSSEDVLEEGDVITIEPGLYYKDIGGIRLEDMLLVTATGARNLTIFPKYLIYSKY